MREVIIKHKTNQIASKVEGEKVVVEAKLRELKITYTMLTDYMRDQVIQLK